MLNVLHRTIEANKEPLFLRVYYLTPVKILHGKYRLIKIVCEFIIAAGLKARSNVNCSILIYTAH